VVDRPLKFAGWGEEGIPTPRRLCGIEYGQFTRRAAYPCSPNGNDRRPGAAPVFPLTAGHVRSYSQVMSNRAEQIIVRCLWLWKHGPGGARV
jgi:hypothetical protein